MDNDLQPQGAEAALPRAKEEVPDLVALSLRDRDDEPAETVKADLIDPTAGTDAGFHPRRWRRRYIESYLIWPPAIAAAAGLPEDQVVEDLRDRHGIAVGPSFTATDPPQALLDVRAKQILKPGGGMPVLGQFNAAPQDVARHMDPASICTDMKTFLADVERLVG